MTLMATVSSIIAILACLLLVSRHSVFREMGVSQTVRLALIWAVIIVAMVLVVQIVG